MDSFHAVFTFAACFILPFIAGITIDPNASGDIHVMSMLLFIANCAVAVGLYAAKGPQWPLWLLAILELTIATVVCWQREQGKRRKQAWLHQQLLAAQQEDVKEAERERAAYREAFAARVGCAVDDARIDRAFEVLTYQGREQATNLTTLGKLLAKAEARKRKRKEDALFNDT